MQRDSRVLFPLRTSEPIANRRGHRAHRLGVVCRWTEIAGGKVAEQPKRLSEIAAGGDGLKLVDIFSLQQPRELLREIDQSHGAVRHRRVAERADVPELSEQKTLRTVPLPQHHGFCQEPGLLAPPTVETRLRQLGLHLQHHSVYVFPVWDWHQNVNGPDRLCHDLDR